MSAWNMLDTVPGQLFNRCVIVVLNSIPVIVQMFSALLTCLPLPEQLEPGGWLDKNKLILLTKMVGILNAHLTILLERVKAGLLFSDLLLVL